MTREGASLIRGATALCKSLSGTLFKMSSEHTCTLLSSSALNEEDRKGVRSLYEANMSSLHSLIDSSSTTSQPGDSYFFHPDAMYLIVKHHESLIAFAMFKVEWDDLDVPELPVVYLYELQVSNSWRSQGVGSLLLSTLENIMSEHLRSMINKMVRNLSFLDAQ